MDPQTNIMTRKSRISKLVRIAFKPPIESFDFGSSRSMSIWKIRVHDYFKNIFILDRFDPIHLESAEQGDSDENVGDDERGEIVGLPLLG